MNIFNQQPTTYGQGFNQPQQTKAQDFELHIREAAQLNNYFLQRQQEGEKRINEVTSKLESNKNSLKQKIESSLNKPQAQKPSDSSEQFLNWADGLESVMKESLDEVRKKNELITQKIIEAHKSLEHYAKRQQKISRNTSRELSLVREVDELRQKLSNLAIKLDEHEKRLQFSEAPTDWSENERAKDFNEQSIDVLNSIKTDYIKSKIILDKNKHYLQEMDKVLNEVKR